MRRYFVAMAATFCVFDAASAASDDLSASLVARPDVSAMSIFGASNGQNHIPAPNLPGASAIRVEVPAPKPGSHPWDVGVGVVTDRDIAKGDHVTVVFWARAEAAAGHLTARLQSNDAPYNDIAQQDYDLDGTWRLFRLQGTAGETFLAARSGLSFAMNTMAQVVEIGPAYIFTSDVPTTRLEAKLRKIPIGGAIDAVIDTPSGNRLAATLRYPAGAAPYPAIMTIAGSGPWGRNPNDQLSLAMLDRGIAVLQYDKRGVGQSTGDFATTTQDDLTEDASAVAAWLRKQPRIASSATGSLGISQGGMIALAVAARDPKVSFAITMAGPAVPMYELMIEQQTTAAADRGATPDQVNNIDAALRRLIDAIKAASSDDDAVVRAKAALTPYIGTVFTQAQADAIAKVVHDPKVRASYLFDPKEELERIRVPVLGLFGTKDHLVAADANAAALRLDLAGDKDVTVKVLPGLNHSFQHAKTGTLAEMGQLTEAGGSDPALQKLIIDWILSHTR